MTPRCSTASGTKERITAMPSGRPATATRTSIPPGTEVLKDCPRAASSMLDDLGAGTPTTVPSGRKIVTGVLLAALTPSTVICRLRSSSVVTSGSIRRRAQRAADELGSPVRMPAGTVSLDKRDQP